YRKRFSFHPAFFRSARCRDSRGSRRTRMPSRVTGLGSKGGLSLRRRSSFTSMSGGTFSFDGGAVRPGVVLVMIRHSERGVHHAHPEEEGGPCGGGRARAREQGARAVQQQENDAWQGG